MDKWDLLYIGTAYVEVHTFKWKGYVTVKDFNTTTDALSKKVLELEEENKKLKEFKTKREESRFYFKAQMERAEPKTAREAEDLQKAKEIFEKLYREELSCLEKENTELKDAMKVLNNYNKFRIQENQRLKKENEELQEYKRRYEWLW